MFPDYLLGRLHPFEHSEIYVIKKKNEAEENNKRREEQKKHNSEIA